MTNPAAGDPSFDGLNFFNQELYPFSESERDALGEIGNICMGTSATTLSTLLGKKVSITTPRVSLSSCASDLGPYQKPYVAIEVSYTSGIDGYNILLMKDEDVLAITDLLMGGDGVVPPDAQVEELQLSAIGEVMNQMVGSASTALSNIIMVPVNISPPTTKKILLEDDNLEELVCGTDTTIVISFSMEIEGVLQSELMQIMPFEFGKKLAGALLDNMMGTPEPAAPAAAATPATPASSNRPAPQMQGNASVRPSTPPAQHTASNTNRVSVKSVQYPSFDEPPVGLSQNPLEAELGDSLNLILDVPLQVTVELGKCRKSIKEILALNMGSVIVLDRLAGEMVDIMVNGKLFARGEVVVIDDNYGVRVTEIIANSQGTGTRARNALFDTL